MIDYDRDYNIDFFGFKTLERAYLMHLEDKTILETFKTHMLAMSLFIRDKDNIIYIGIVMIFLSIIIYLTNIIVS